MTRDQRTWLFLGVGCALLLGAVALSFLGSDKEPAPKPDSPPLGTPEPMATDGGPDTAVASETPTSLTMSPDGEPIPPQQAAKWQAPYAPDISPEAFAAFDAFYPLGLPDPRGCTYRSVTLRVTRGQDCALTPTQVHAFVLPGKDRSDRSWAIAWDGLLYPVEQVGPPADLKFDVLDGLNFHQDEQHAVRDLAWLKVRGQVFPDAWTGVQHGLVRPVRAALLFRLGHADLAHRVWMAWLRGRHPLERGPALANLLADWLWARYHRGLCAHARGETATVERDANHLVRLAPRVESALKKEKRVCPFSHGSPQYCAWFWSAVDALLADAEARKLAPPTGSDETSKRIAALAEVASWAEPAGWSDPFAQHPAVRAVAELGPAAVEPLLACLQEGQTLSRTVWTRERQAGLPPVEVVTHEPVGTHRLCYSALQTILGSAGLPRIPIGPGTTEEEHELRKAATVQARAFWEEHARQLEEQRHLDVLSNDTQGPSRWLEAARGLLARPAGDWFASPDAARLTALLDRRAEALSKEFVAPHQGRDLWLASITRRIQAGDKTAFDDWATFMLRTDPFNRFSQDVLAFFAPLLDHPEQPTCQQVAQALFGKADSPWLPLLKRRSAGWGRGLLRSPLLALEPLRKQVLERLADQSPVGKYGAQGPDGTWSYEPGDWDTGSAQPRSQRLRVCDLYAYQLSMLGGVPAFRSDWPEARRDAAILQIRDFVSGPLPARITRPDENSRLSQIAFTGRDSPASREDVKAGRAIFSLQGLGEVRVHPLPRVPVKAWWLGPLGREHALVWQAEVLVRDGHRQVFAGLVRENGVDMVPADQVLLDPDFGLNPPIRFSDQTQVGFVLSAQERWGRSSRTGRDDRPTWMVHLEQRRASRAGGPIWVTIGAINLGLEPVRVPARLSEPHENMQGEQTERIILGVELKVGFSPAGLDPNRTSYTTVQRRDIAWNTNSSTVRLAPLEKKLWKLDLGRLYRLDDPGRLRVEVEALPGLGRPKRGSYLEFEVFPAP